MTTDSNDPAEEASPMGSKVSGKRREASQQSGTRAQRMDSELWINGIMDRPQAQKYPLKLKWMPAKMQSHT